MTSLLMRVGIADSKALKQPVAQVQFELRALYQFTEIASGELHPLDPEVEDTFGSVFERLYMAATDRYRPFAWDERGDLTELDKFMVLVQVCLAISPRHGEDDDGSPAIVAGRAVPGRLLRLAGYDAEDRDYTPEQVVGLRSVQDVMTE